MGDSCKNMGQKSEAKASDVDDHIVNRYEMKKRLGKGVSFMKKKRRRFEYYSSYI